MPTGDIVILCTQADKLVTGKATGVWAEEVAAPWYVFKEAGYSVILGSISGGKIPLEPTSLQGDAVTPITQKWLDDEEAQAALKESQPISKIDFSKVAAVFASGGHGAALDFPESKEVASIIESFYSAGKITAGLCHGPAIYALAKDKSGSSLVKGKKVTGFSLEGEKQIGEIPGLEAPESLLRRLGGSYSDAGDPWGGHVQIDTSGSGPIITGQNPNSSKGTAEAVLKILKPAS